MKKSFFLRKFDPIQILAIGCFLILVIASISTLLFQTEWSGISIIPHLNIVIPAINIISAVLSLFIFFFPQKNAFLYSVLILQSFFCPFTGDESFGVFLFSLFIILIYLNGSISISKQRKVIILLYLIYAIDLLGCIPYGIYRYLIAAGTSLFIATAFYCIIYSYKKKLTNIIPLIQQELYISKEIMLPRPGEIMKLSNYDLTERQRILLYEVINNNRSYGELALKYNVSLSLVKKEMAIILQYFGCKKIDSLKIILNQFILTL